jgi:hypothetical protein
MTLLAWNEILVIVVVIIALLVIVRMRDTREAQLSTRPLQSTHGFSSIIRSQSGFCLLMALSWGFRRFAP